MMSRSKVLVSMFVVVAIAFAGSFVFFVSASDNTSTTREHGEELRGLRQEFRETVILPKLEEWFGDEIPEGLMALRNNLTEEQKLELRGLRQEFRETVILPKLEGWGVELPARRGGMRFRGGRIRGLCKP